MVADLTLVGGAWLLAYGLRFGTGLPVPLGVPNLSGYLYPLWVILPVFFLSFRSHGLYTARRMDSPLGEAGAVLRASILSLLVLAASSFFFRSYSYSRGTGLLFAGLAPLAVIGMRSTIRFALRAVRRRGFNLRFALVVGSGPLAEGVIQRITSRPEAGLRLVGVVADGAMGDRVAGVPVVGRYGDLSSIFERQRIDQVLVALSRHEADVFEKVITELERVTANVKIVPDLLHGLTLRSTIENLDGLPVIGLQETALRGWGAVAKRAFDLLGASAALVLFAPALLGIAALIGLTSGAPIFYRQRRMGHDGRVFEMLKFRSMRVDAEVDGPGWTRPEDPRRTAIGRWLRRYNLDELPQLINVVRGEMSLVGPRPERPAFIEEFRGRVPGYMLRHKVRAGMTGWAQVHGWRGDTSIQERVEHDLYYVQKWSFGLDIRILLMTLLRGGRSKARATASNAAAASDSEGP
jgi:exopolysaccharide biosynthesis polyprenyl glycosylphosphotransferase